MTKQKTLAVVCSSVSAKLFSVIVLQLLIGIPVDAADNPIAKPAERPNIVLIMADDMGYEALSVNGSESCKTPNLDKFGSGLECVSPIVSPTLCVHRRG